MIKFRSVNELVDLLQDGPGSSGHNFRFTVPNSSIFIRNLNKVIGSDRAAQISFHKIEGITWGFDPIDWRPTIFEFSDKCGDFVGIVDLDWPNITKTLFCMGCDLSQIPTAEVDGMLCIFAAKMTLGSYDESAYSNVSPCSDREFGTLLNFVAEAYDLNPEYDADRIWRGALLNLIQLQSVEEESAERKVGTVGEARLIESMPLFRGYAAIDDVWITHQRFNGDWTPPFRRSVVGWGDAVTVLPYDPARDLVLLIEQFRAGPFLRGDVNPWCNSVVAGRMDRLERPEDTARREAEEEAGVPLGRLEKVAGYYSSPGLSKEYITCFVGEADLQLAGGQFGERLEDEDIRATVVSLDEALSRLFDGKILVGHAYIAILALSHQREEIKRKWLKGN
jgi:nudix-type nucleoside diphosphatase (YffH/AdpP family)